MSSPRGFLLVMMMMIVCTSIMVGVVMAGVHTNRLFGYTASRLRRGYLSNKHCLMGTRLAEDTRLDGWLVPSQMVKIRGGSQAVEEDDADEDDDDVDVDDEDDEEDEEEDDDEEKESVSVDSLSMSTPVSVVVRANVGSTDAGRSPILDQTVELTLQRRRSVSMLKESLRRALPNKPPVSLLTLRYQGRVLADHTLLDELVDDDDDEDEDDDEEEDDEDSKSKLCLTLDMIPPVDAKEMQLLWSNQLEDLSTSELLRLYATNEAALHETTLALLEHSTPTTERKKDVNDDDDEEDDTDEAEDPAQAASVPVSSRIEERAKYIEEQLVDLLMRRASRPEIMQAILDDPQPPSAHAHKTEIRGERVIVSGGNTGGVTRSLRAQLQYWFNVPSWAATIRTMCLFVFFGLVGGRTPLSKAILLLAAPSVLVLQARPVKVFWKQFLYTLIQDPPGIVLSLLPAPQQTIFQLAAWSKALQTLYGPYTTETLQSQPRQRTRWSLPSDDDDKDANELDEAEEEEFWDAREEEEDDDDDDE